MSPRTRTRVKATMDSSAMRWVTVLTPLFLAAFAVRQGREAKQESAAVASSIGSAVQDVGQLATQVQALSGELAGAKRKIARLERAIGTARRVVSEYDTGSPLGPDYVEPPKRGLLSSATGVLGGALRGFGAFLFGGK